MRAAILLGPFGLSTVASPRASGNRDVPRKAIFVNPRRRWGSIALVVRAIAMTRETDIPPAGLLAAALLAAFSVNG
jgi:hypothetical protein